MIPRQDIAVKRLPVKTHRILKTIAVQEGLTMPDIIEAATFSLLVALQAGSMSTREMIKRMRGDEFDVKVRMAASAEGS